MGINTLASHHGECCLVRKVGYRQEPLSISLSQVSWRLAACVMALLSHATHVDLECRSSPKLLSHLGNARRRLTKAIKRPQQPRSVHDGSAKSSNESANVWPSALLLRKRRARVTSCKR